MSILRVGKRKTGVAWRKKLGGLEPCGREGAVRNAIEREGGKGGSWLIFGENGGLLYCLLVRLMLGVRVGKADVEALTVRRRAGKTN